MVRFSITTVVVATIIPSLTILLAATPLTIANRGQRDAQLSRRKPRQLESSVWANTGFPEEAETNNNHRFLVRGEAWVNPEARGPITDNIFLHDLPSKNYYSTAGECACGRRRRKLGVGHDDSACICDNESPSSPTQPPTAPENGKGHYYSDKKSKGSKGKGYGGGDYYEYHYASKKSKDDKKSKKEKSEKSYGKGYVQYDDDYLYPTREPTTDGRPSMVPPSEPTLAPTLGQPSAPSVAPDGFAPHNNGRNDTNHPTLKPTSRPTPPKGDPPARTCIVNDQGIYGDRIGLSTVFNFLYQVQVIPVPIVTVDDINNVILRKVEVEMGNELLPKLFPATCRTATGRKLGESKRRRRELQGLDINGMGIKPRDAVDESAQCDNVKTGSFPCYVIKGAVTIFSTQRLNQIEQIQIENAIQQTIISGNLVAADNKLLTLTFSSFGEIVEEEPPDDGGGGSGGGGLLQRIRDTDWWILLCVVLGIVLVLVLCMGLITWCVKRRRRQQVQRVPDQPSPNPKTDIEVPLAAKDDDSSSDGSNGDSISDFGPSGPVLNSNEPRSNDYHYHSSAHISEDLMPDLDEPIVEEKQEDLSGSFPESLRQQQQQRSATNVTSNLSPKKTKSSPVSNEGNGANNYDLYMPDDRLDDQYNGVSYEDRIYQNNQNMGYNPLQYGSPIGDDSGSHSESPPNDQTPPSFEGSNTENRSRSLHRAGANTEFRALDGRRTTSPGLSPANQQDTNGFGSSTPASTYSSDIYSATSRQASYQSDDPITEEGGDDDSSYEDVEEEYEIEYTSASEVIVDASESAYEEVWPDENDHNTSNRHTSTSGSSQQVTTNSSSRSNSSNSRSHGSRESFDEGSTPLPFLAHNAQLQQHSNKNTTSFDTLRNKWEQT